MSSEEENQEHNAKIVVQGVLQRPADERILRNSNQIKQQGLVRERGHNSRVSSDSSAQNKLLENYEILRFFDIQQTGHPWREGLFADKYNSLLYVRMSKHKGEMSYYATFLEIPEVFEKQLTRN